VEAKPVGATARWRLGQRAWAEMCGRGPGSRQRVWRLGIRWHTQCHSCIDFYHVSLLMHLDSMYSRDFFHYCKIV
jgi:hypothetical protein